MRCNKIIRQPRFFAESRAEIAIGIIADLLLAKGAIGQQYIAPEYVRENRLNAARNITGEERDGACWGN